MNINPTPTIERAPCEEKPRRCCTDSCRYYSVLHSACRYHELKGRYRHATGTPEGYSWTSPGDESESPEAIIYRKQRELELREALGGTV